MQHASKRTGLVAVAFGVCLALAAGLLGVDTAAASSPAVVIEDGDGRINASEVDAGVTVSYSLPPDVTDVILTLRNASGTVPLACRRTGLPTAGAEVFSSGCFDQLDEGEIVARVAGTDPANETVAATDSSVFDLTAPTTTYTTQDGDSFQRLWIGVPFCCNIYLFAGDIEGTTTDANSEIQFVYIQAKNLDTSKHVAGVAQMSALADGSGVSWSFDMSQFEAGEWEVKAFSQDFAGNLEDPKTIHVFVDGL